MRIIAGTARSLPLRSLEGRDTRPTIVSKRRYLTSFSPVSPGAVFWICLREPDRLASKR